MENRGFFWRCCINVGVAKFVPFPLDLSTSFYGIGHGFSDHQHAIEHSPSALQFLGYPYTARTTAAQSVTCNGLCEFQRPTDDDIRWCISTSFGLDAGSVGGFHRGLREGPSCFRVVQFSRPWRGGMRGLMGEPRFGKLSWRE